MSVLDKASDVLSKRLLKDNKPCTYKLLSRLLSVHVSDAKKLLYTFYLQHKDMLAEPTYIIVGQLRDSQEQVTVKVTRDLDHKSQFSQIYSVQIYALCGKGAPTADEIAHMVRPELQAFDVSEESMRTWGMIEGPELLAPPTRPATTQPVASSRPATTTAPTPAPSTTTTRAPTEEKPKREDRFKDMGLASSRIRAKYQKEEPKKAKSQSSQPTFGRSAFSKSEPKRGNTEPTEAKTEVIEDEELPDEEYIKKQDALKKEKERKQKELASMFDDDDGDDLVEVDDPEVKEQEEKQKDDLENMFDDDDNDKVVESQPKEETPVAESKPKKESKPRAQKVEKEASTYVDEDGFIVTKVETKPAPKKRATPASATAAQSTPKRQKTAAKQQTSLMSFFGKKR